MTDERDPRLQALFDSARQIELDDAFVERVMADVDRARRRTVIGWIVAGVLLLPIASWIYGPIMTTFDIAAQLLPGQLVSVEGDWMAQLLAPVNSAAGIAGLLFVAGWWFYRKIFA